MYFRKTELIKATFIPQVNWTYFDIPINSMGVDTDQNTFDSYETGALTISCFGYSINVRSPTTVAFDFEISEVCLFRDPNLRKVRGIYPLRPVMYASPMNEGKNYPEDEDDLPNYTTFETGARHPRAMVFPN